MSSEILDRSTEPFARKDVATVRLTSVMAGAERERTDWVAVEEPLEIRAKGPGQKPISVAVTMRTPGDDAELAVGFLATEGLIAASGDVVGVGPCRGGGLKNQSSCNIVLVALSRPFDEDRLKRNFFATSSCGICGKASLEQVTVRCEPIQASLVVSSDIILALPDRLRAAQGAFDRTGGLHAAGLFESDGSVYLVREDVGRHNAVDKLVGRAFLDGCLPLAGRILMVSGRTSFEILQKAAVAGVPIVCAVSAPSSLAISLAERLGITLIGFLRGDSFNVYTHPDRIKINTNLLSM